MHVIAIIALTNYYVWLFSLSKLIFNYWKYFSWFIILGYFLISQNTTNSWIGCEGFQIFKDVFRKNFLFYFCSFWLESFYFCELEAHAKFQNPTTIFLNNPLSPQIYDSSGGRGVPKIFVVGILLFLLVRSPCKISETNNNFWKYPLVPPNIWECGG